MGRRGAIRPAGALRLRTWVPVVLLGVLFVLQVLEPWEVYLYFLLGLGGLLGACYYWAREMGQKVSLRREMPTGWLFVGDTLEETFHLTNRSWLPVLWAEVVDHSDVPGYSASVVQAADGHEAKKWRMRGTCVRRGAFRLGPWEVHLGDPFGLFEVTLRYAEEAPLMVYPPVVRLPALTLPRGQATGHSGLLRPGVEATTDAASVREYLPGDSLRRIHWRSVARLGRWVVREFDVESSGDLWVVLDLDASVQAGEGEESTLEYGVVLAASLLALTLADRRAAGLVAFGQEAAFLMPSLAPEQLAQALRLLAQARPGPAPLWQVLRQMQPNIRRGTAVALITPSTSPEWLAEVARLRQREVVTTAILLDAASFRSSPSEAASGGLLGLRQGLAMLGVPSFVVSRGYPFVPWLRRRRRRTVYRALATGRVIPVDVVEEV
ncbi:MAG: DUF58 domain-containing protein [Anaerolineae bacterium]